MSTTALTASGVHLILFTTGRGTPLEKQVPTIKISSNSNLAKSKKRWTGFDAGILLGKENIDDVQEIFFSYALEVASENIKTHNEENNFREIAIFKSGITL